MEMSDKTGQQHNVYMPLVNPRGNLPVAQDTLYVFVSSRFLIQSFSSMLNFKNLPLPLLIYHPLYSLMIPKGCHIVIAYRAGI